MKCDERPNGCLNCERLQLNCVQHPANGTSTAEQTEAPRSITGIKRKRTFRVCVPCRQSKIKCSGERPACSKCSQRSMACIYDSESTVEPAWVRNVSTQQSPLDRDPSTESPSIHSFHYEGGLSASPAPQPGNCPPSLAWYAPSTTLACFVHCVHKLIAFRLLASDLPSSARLRSLLEAYFDNVHPVRVSDAINVQSGLFHYAIIRSSIVATHSEARSID